MEDLDQAKKQWEEGPLKGALETAGEWKEAFATASGIPVKGLYTPSDLKDISYVDDLGFPGQYPFTRGISPTMYRGSVWMMFQYGGFGTPESTNEWFKYVLKEGARMLAIAQDLPSQMGLDSDNPLSRGEVGKVGVSLDSLEDMEVMFDGIPIEQVAISTTSNATGPIFLALMLALAERRGTPPQQLTLSIQNDVLKEFISRHTHIFPPRPSLKFSCDVVEYCSKNGLNNVRSPIICGYHMREAGANAIQELAYTLSNAAAFAEELVSRGVDLNAYFRPMTALCAGLDFFEEICKHRAFRRMFARMMKERFNVENPMAMAIGMYDNSQASAFTAQQPLNNIIRGTITGMVQALSGIQVMSIACYDEAHAIPSAEAVRIGLRTQQILAYETGVVNTADPLAGSYYVESLTDQIEERVTKVLEEIDELGGAVTGIEQGFQEGKIAEEAYEHLKRVKSGAETVVGVNKFQVEEKVPLEIMKVDPEVEKNQIEKLARLKKSRNNTKVESALGDIKKGAEEETNLVAPILTAVKAYATIGEICDALRDVYGEYNLPPYRST